jgi:uncharacterized protein (TIGR02145 family)
MKSRINVLGIILIIILFNECKKDNGDTKPETGTLADIDGNIYKTIKIGNQWWMAEDLKTTKYSNGDLIPTTSPSSLNISGESNPKYQWDYSSVTNISTDDYGRTYTWYAVTDSRNVCPAGWHVPVEDEWIKLRDFLGGQDLAGSKLKEVGITHWLRDTGATNESGFTALPCGYRGGVSTFIGIAGLHIMGYWWSATQIDDMSAYILILDHLSTNAYVGSNCMKYYGCCVRCVED